MKYLKLILLLTVLPLIIHGQKISYSLTGTTNKRIIAIVPSGYAVESGKKVSLKECLNYPNYGTGYYIEYDGMAILISKSDINKIDLDKPIDNSALWQTIRLKSDIDQSLLSKGFQYDLRKDLEDDNLELIQNLQINNGFLNDEYLEDYIQTLLYKIHSITLDDGRPGNISVKILRSSTPNAFCTSYGTIIINTGLLSTIRSEDELIGVLAHEVAHFVLDHQVVNINKAVTRQKRAEFWAGVATAIAAASDVYLSSKNEYYTPGGLTMGTAVLSYSIASSIIERLGVNYNQEQEWDADKAATMVLVYLNKDPKAMAAALSRIKNYCVLNGDYFALTGSGTHPGLDERINKIGSIDPSSFNNPQYDRLISLVNTLNASGEYYNKHIQSSLDLTNRNIEAGVATEEDYILKAMSIKQLNDTPEKNQEALDLILKAKTLNVNPNNYIYKQEGITLLRLHKNNDAKEAFKIYLNNLEKITDKYGGLIKEIEWTRKMIYKVNLL